MYLLHLLRRKLRYGLHIILVRAGNMTFCELRDLKMHYIFFLFLVIYPYDTSHIYDRYQILAPI